MGLFNRPPSKLRVHLWRYFLCGVHLLILSLFLFRNAPTQPIKPHRMTVRSLEQKIVAPPPKNHVAKKSSSLQPVKSNQVPIKAPIKKPSAVSKLSPKPLPKTLEKKIKDVPVEEIKSKKSKKDPLVSENLRRQLEESVAKIEENNDNFMEKKQNPKIEHRISASLTLSSLASEAADLDARRSRLVQELKSCLHLPDFGEVMVSLVVNSDGSIAEVKILKSSSKKNTDYLEKELKRRIFSFVGGNEKLQEEPWKVTVTFCNSTLNIK